MHASERSPLLSLAVPCLFLTACIQDYSLNKWNTVDEVGDGYVTDPDYIETHECYETTLYSTGNSDHMGWTEPWCAGHVEGPNSPGFTPGGQLLDSFEIIGWTDGTFQSAFPGEFPVRAVGNGHNGTDYGNLPGTATSLASDDLTDAAGIAGNWGVDASSAEIGNFNSCHPNCDYQVFAEIQAAEAELISCTEHHPMYFCPVWLETTARRRTSVMSTCESGAGTFRLYPARTFNADADSSYSVILQAVQVSGTGALTNAAWVTSIGVTQGRGLTLRVIKANRDFKFDGSDQLVDSAIVGAVVGSSTSFNSGIVSGGAPFVVVEAPESTLVPLVVDMSWTCATPTEQEELSPSQGYSFKLSDVGCNVDWPQKFTIRPEPFVGAKALRVERYGVLADSRKIPLHASSQGKDFSYEVGGLVLKGSLLSYSANNAQVRFDEISWDGVNICTTGTRTLATEG